MYKTFITIDPALETKDHHAVVNKVFYGNTTTGNCPRFKVADPELLEVFSEQPPKNVGEGVSVSEYVPPTGDIRIYVKAVAVRRVNGVKKPYPPETEHKAMIARFREFLTKCGVTIIDKDPKDDTVIPDYFRCKFGGTVKDDSCTKHHKYPMILPTVNLVAEVHCDDVKVVEKIILNGFGSSKYLGLGTPTIIKRRRKCDDSQS